MASSSHASKTGRKQAVLSNAVDGKHPEPLTRPPLSPEQVAQLLHDTVCQELTGIGFLAMAAAHQYRARDPQAEQQFREIADLIQRAGTHLAEIVHEMRSPGQSKN